MPAMIKLVTLTALLTALFVHGTAFAQNNGDLSGHRASNAAKMPSATAYVPSNAYGSAAPYSVPAAGHRSVHNNIVNKSRQLERDERRHLDDPYWIIR